MRGEERRGEERRGEAKRGEQRRGGEGREGGLRVYLAAMGTSSMRGKKFQARAPPMMIEIRAWMKM
eukprot:19529-Hanusia_phi.AAC.1